MASTSTINAWVDELASSFLLKKPATAIKRERKLHDTFRRRLRHHNFARTNQFQVRDALSGLEEKFQVLNRDDLSDALYERRLELDRYYENWIPDVLDLLLRLSDDPVQKTRLIDLNGVSHSNELPHLLKWADVEAGDPLDRRDPIWRIPDFSDLSSDEDEVISSSTVSSPTSSKNQRKGAVPVDQQRINIYDSPDLTHANRELESLHILNNSSSVMVTEIQLVREILLMFQGYPSNILVIKDQKILLDHRVKLQTLSSNTLGLILTQASCLRTDLDEIKRWLELDCSMIYIQATKRLVEDSLQAYMSSLCSFEEKLLHPISLQVVSILEIVADVEDLGRPLATLAGWIRNTKASDPIWDLDTLYELTVECYFTSDVVGLNTLLPICLKALEAYLKPIHAWLRSGVLLPTSEQFFVRLRESAASSNTLWNDLYELNLSGIHRAPKFLAELVPTILACGKTSTFIRCIDQGSLDGDAVPAHSEDVHHMVHSAAADPIIPFSAAFPAVLHSYFAAFLASRTQILRHLLETKCGFTRTLNTFELVYLRKQGALLDSIETRIFARIDKCMDNWNDKFLIADMLEEVQSKISDINLESISIQSAHTSSRSMASRRRSVRILGAFAIDYAVPWPVANIIPKVSLAAYRRIALHLVQIRRTKYVLERITYLQVQSTAISDNTRDQLSAQATTFMLIQFVNALYDHFTTGVTMPSTAQMRGDLSAATNVDEMIHVHRTYITNLEFACLTSKQLRPLRETLIGLLDMCIRFSDLLSSSNPHHGTDDFETGSFKSARSHTRRRRREVTSEDVDVDVDDASDDDDDDEDEDEIGDEGEGYSSFIVLDEDTTPVQEMRKLQVQFKRQLDFFIAGLRSVTRGDGTVEEFEILADRLEWKGKPSTLV